MKSTDGQVSTAYLHLGRPARLHHRAEEFPGLDDRHPGRRPPTSSAAMPPASFPSSRPGSCRCGTVPRGWSRRRARRHGRRSISRPMPTMAGVFHWSAPTFRRSSTSRRSARRARRHLRLRLHLDAAGHRCGGYRVGGLPRRHKWLGGTLSLVQETSGRRCRR